MKGRLYVQGTKSLSCRDVYTGRVLWQRTFENLGTNGLYFDTTYKEAPLDTAYNQVHIPGANGRGTNYVVTPESIYLAIGSECQLLNPLNGKTLRTITLPSAGIAGRQWGYIGVYEDVLLAGNGFANFRSRHDLKFAEYDKDLKRNSLGYGFQGALMSPRALGWLHSIATRANNCGSWMLRIVFCTTALLPAMVESTAWTSCRSLWKSS